MSARTDTIVAAATPPGRGGIGIVRISGSLVPAIARAMLGRLPLPRQATHARFNAVDGGAIDTGLALFFPAPHSYTGEDVLELQGHGGPVPIEALISHAVRLGARRAQPGEFTQRAYLNDRIDLAQAEAVADLIDAGSEAAARAAFRSMQGEFSVRVRALDEALAQLRAYVEATIDFPPDEIDHLADDALAALLGTVRAQCTALQATARQGRLLTEGLTVVLAGAPNAGKSTLLNALAGFDAAIVTPVPGTTRDVLRERIQVDGVPVLLLDTAGLREGGDDIENEGMRRARAAMAQADRILFLVDPGVDPTGAALAAERAALPEGVPLTIVFSKMDLLAPPAPAASPSLESAPGAPQFSVSARTGAGLDALRTHLLEAAGFQGQDSGLISARRRHLEALAATSAHVDVAAAQCRAAGAGELVAEELRAAQRALGEITGGGTADELLGRIFASFCIGK